MQQRSNFWIFLLLSTAVLLGWMWVQMQFGPAPKKNEDQQQQAEKEPDKKKPEVEPGKKPDTKPPANERIPTTNVLLAAVGPISGNPVLNAVAVVLGKKETELREQESALANKPSGPPPKIETIILGDDKDFYLKAVLTTRGGGVQRLTLNRFQAASWEGRPEFVNGQPLALDLIPEDPIKPSFLMYHYADPTNAEDARPDSTLGEQVWTYLEGESRRDGDERRVVFETRGPAGYEHLVIRKTFSLNARAYHIGLKIDITDSPLKAGAAPGQRKLFRYQLEGAHGMPIEGEWYATVYRNAIIGSVNASNVLYRTLQDASKISYLAGGDRIEGASQSSGLQYAAIATQSFASAIVVSDKQAEGVEPRQILAYARPTLESNERPCFVDHWKDNEAHVRLADENRTVLVVKLLPRSAADLERLQPKSGDELVVNLYRNVLDGKEVYVAGEFRLGKVVKPFLEDITVRVVSSPLDLGPGDSRSHEFLLYHGPVKVTQLTYVSDKAGVVEPGLVTRYADTLHLATLTDYPSTTWFWWWSELIMMFTRFMHWLLNVLYWIIPVPGITIILMTVIVRALMFPISRKQAQTAMRMQELAPEIKRLQEKYKTDPAARNQAVMELYRKHNVNPVGGCLPLLLQLPIFLGLYFALQESIRFRLAPFLWIENLGAPDMLFYWGQSLPWVTSPDSQGGMLYLGPYFNILPVLAVAIMIVSQKMMMPPAQDEQQEMQQKMMTYMLVFMGLLFYKVAAGLSIYFIATTLWGIGERKFMPKKKPAALPPTDGTPPSGNAAPRGPAEAPRLTPAQRRKLKAKGKKQEQQQPDSTLKKVRDWWEEVLKQAKKK